MKIPSLVISLIVIVIGGCASTETVKESEGQGITRTYPYPYDLVYDATISAAKTQELEIVETDKSNGRLIFKHGVTLWSWGENIAVFIKPQSTNSTEVEIVSEPVMAPFNIPPDWQHILLDKIDEELRSGK